MTTAVIDPTEVFVRGHSSLAGLTHHERLVFLLSEFETLMIMEGWDDFFTSRWAEHYPEMKTGLSLTNDHQSVAILDDYESHLRTNGVPLESAAIDSFLARQESKYFTTCRDWRDDYLRLSEIRWSKVTSYLKANGITLLA